MAARTPEGGSWRAWQVCLALSQAVSGLRAGQAVSLEGSREPRLVLIEIPEGQPDCLSKTGNTLKMKVRNWEKRSFLLLGTGPSPLPLRVRRRAWGCHAPALFDCPCGTGISLFPTRWHGLG